MRLTDEEVAARIAAAPEHDVCVLRIEEGDFGCEERREPAPLWLLCQTADGKKFSLDIPETRVEALGLTEGCTCRKVDLYAKRGAARFGPLLAFKVDPNWSHQTA